MSKEVICAKCGQGNVLGHMFCAKCGARLDMSRMSASQLQRGGGFRLPSLALVIRLLLAAAVVALVVAVIWPTEPRGARGLDTDARQYKEQRAELDRCLHAGQAGKAEFTEPEVNAYLAGVLRNEAASNQTALAFWQMHDPAYNLAFGADAITVHWSAALGPLTITYEITGEPRVGEGPFWLQVKSGRWGHLTLPRGAARWMATRMAACFNRWQTEHTLLDHAGALEVQQGRLTLTVKKGSGGGLDRE